MTDLLFDSIYQEDIYSFSAPVTVVLPFPYEQLKENLSILLSNILRSIRQTVASVRIIQQSSLDASLHTK